MRLNFENEYEYDNDCENEYEHEHATMGRCVDGRTGVVT